MAREGKKVLLVDTDPQGSMTISLGNQQPDQLALACDQSIQAVLARQQQIDVVLPLIVGGHGLRHKPFLPRRGIVGKQPFAAQDVQLSLIAFNIGNISILLRIEQVAV